MPTAQEQSKVIARELATYMFMYFLRLITLAIFTLYAERTEDIITRLQY